ncbi:MAG: hypothetical protein OXQ29_25535 [Rhodospirillaceae bacterium]|nr:hypothetical protein [Rhodospirillaceae bacterium]
MGECRHCQRPAGFLKKSHRECEEKHTQGKAEIVSLVGRTGIEGFNPDAFKRDIEQIALTSFVDRNLLKSLIVSGWERAVKRAFDDGLLSEEEENALVELQRFCSLSSDELNKNGAYEKVVKGGILRDISNEKEIKGRIRVGGNLPFNFQRSEKLVWLFQDVDYFEHKTRTHYTGGSQGVSIRIAKGFWYRTGGFKGERVQTTEVVHADTGLLGVTSKHIYFSGSLKSFRVAYTKIVAFEPYSDGIGIQRDAMTAKPQDFVTGDGWFTYNLISNLARMA